MFRRSTASSSVVALPRCSTLRSSAVALPPAAMSAAPRRDRITLNAAAAADEAPPPVAAAPPAPPTETPASLPTRAAAPAADCGAGAAAPDAAPDAALTPPLLDAPEWPVSLRVVPPPPLSDERCDGPPTATMPPSLALPPPSRALPLPSPLRVFVLRSVSAARSLEPANSDSATRQDRRTRIQRVDVARPREQRAQQAGNPTQRPRATPATSQHIVARSTRRQ
jgi:hypothetical protein